MHYTTRAPVFFSIAAALFISIVPARAQQADTGVAIAEFSAGGIFGLGAHGSVGGSLGVPTAKHIVPFIAFSYSPLTSYAYNYGANNTGKGLFTSSMLDVNGGIRIRFTSKSDWVPYVGLGLGLLRLTSSDYTSGFNETATIKTSMNQLAGNVSVGGLYYITPHVGLGLELKAYDAQHTHFAQATVGAFYQFP